MDQGDGPLCGDQGNRFLDRNFLPGNDKAYRVYNDVTITYTLSGKGWGGDTQAMYLEAERRNTMKRHVEKLVVALSVILTFVNLG